MNREDIFNSSNYIHIMIEYDGTIPKVLKSSAGLYITKVDEGYGIISIENNLYKGIAKIEDYQNIERVRELIENYVPKDSGFKLKYLVLPQVFTLQDISAVEGSGVSYVQGYNTMNLDGTGVVIGIIDTGIDYLNEEFLDDKGETRILSIWDQTIDSNKSSDLIPFGTIYTREEINKAISAYRLGGNPYDIVPSRDDYGHGTGMASIVGAWGKNENLRGMAPRCEFVIVKLSEADFLKRELDLKTPIYSLPFIFVALGYLKKILLSSKKSIVGLLPLGTNNGNHKGDNMLDNYIEEISRNIGIVIVTGAGNEKVNQGHASGIIENKDYTESIDLLVDKKENQLLVEVWVDLPNIIDINLVSPSGEETEFIKSIGDFSTEYTFTFEKTKVKVQYYLPEGYTGEELISLYFSGLYPGIWEIKLKLRKGENAKYNIWLPQGEIVYDGTRLYPSDPYGTVTIPGDSNFAITVAACNQNNNNILYYSGQSFKDEYVDKIDFAAGGYNTFAVGLNNTVQIMNGTSVAAAIGAGACILLFQWGIVQGNFKNMYTQSIKTFLTRGVIKRNNEIYPNPKWGYGVINIYKIFESIT